VEYISKQGLLNLKQYKYSGEDRSILARLFLNKFWKWCVTFAPQWLAPNLITLSGFLLIVANCFLFAYFCPHLWGCELPRWVHLVFALTIFLYQTLDNIDGKQAVRTKSASALGELFDHGSDSLFPALVGIWMLHAIDVGPWFGFLVLHLGILPFYYAHWEEYHTGILILGPIANPTEAQVTLMAAQIATYFTGVHVWSRTLKSLLPADVAAILPSLVQEAKLNVAFVVLASFVALPMLVYSAIEVFKVCTAQKKTFYQSIAPLIPITILSAGTTAWFWVSPNRLLEDYAMLSLPWYGVMVSYLLIRLILDRITKVEFHTWNPIIVLPFIGLAVAVLSKDPHLELFTFYLLTGFALLAYLHMVVSVINELTSYLKIRAFIIPYKQ